jgi:hypothetical protein
MGDIARSESNSVIVPVTHRQVCQRYNAVTVPMTLRFGVFNHTGLAAQLMPGQKAARTILQSSRVIISLHMDGKSSIPRSPIPPASPPLNFFIEYVAGTSQCGVTPLESHCQPKFMALPTF